MTAPFTSPGGPLRVSLLGQHNKCPLAAKMSTEGFTDWSTDPQAAGAAIHGVAERILRKLHSTGQKQMSPEDALDIMHRYAASPDCPHLSEHQLGELRILTLIVASYEWPAHRLVAVEDRLFADIVCPDGKTRTLTGQPDGIFADPPQGGVIVDYKGGWSKPPKPRDGDWDRDKGRPYLGDVFQLSAYGLLGFRRYPAIQRWILREHHLRHDETREARMDRDDIPEVERRLGVLLQRLDTTLAGDMDAEARPGSHCRRQCPRISACPIPAEDRGEGEIEDPARATAVGERFVVADGLRDRDRIALKAWCDTTGERVPVGDAGAWVGWLDKDDGKRSFGLHTAEKGDA